MSSCFLKGDRRNMAESESGIPTLSLESRTQLGARRAGHTQPTLKATGQWGISRPEPNSFPL